MPDPDGVHYYPSPASDFSPTPPAKETAMTTTPKAGDEMIATLAEAPDAGFVKVLGVHNLIPLSALRPLPDPALTAAQLAVVEAVRAWCDDLRAKNYQPGELSLLERVVWDADAALRALSTPPDPMKIAVEALEKLAALDTSSTFGVRQTAQAALAAIAAVVGEPKP